ncbi:hypothetical protein P872_13785 [Rhodonellum psychrophilum GCM71 = DSM 17998]|uniref:Uncharacterized protein n=1 Tax=Rhodonellum psychrophilum GCM71 = DSM 17998 TaxID=1123057 RepID=U5BS85_9BACT|nr:hypothetical protein P872_13785 [Rhodonellum psychrophilum GCM71 = DSM 17998]
MSSPKYAWGVLIRVDTARKSDHLENKTYYRYSGAKNRKQLFDF